MLSLFSFFSSDMKWEHTFLIKSLWYVEALEGNQIFPTEGQNPSSKDSTAPLRWLQTQAREAATPPDLAIWRFGINPQWKRSKEKSLLAGRGCRRPEPAWDYFHCCPRHSLNLGQ